MWILFFQSRVSRREREIENDFSRSSGKKLSWFSRDSREREFPSLSGVQCTVHSFLCVCALSIVILKNPEITAWLLHFSRISRFTKDNVYSPKIWEWMIHWSGWWEADVNCPILDWKHCDLIKSCTRVSIIGRSNFLGRKWKGKRRREAGTTSLGGPRSRKLSTNHLWHRSWSGLPKSLDKSKLFIFH